MKPGKADDPGFRGRGAVPSCTPERDLLSSLALSPASLLAEGGDTTQVASKSQGMTLDDQDARRTMKEARASSEEPEKWRR